MGVQSAGRMLYRSWVVFAGGLCALSSLCSPFACFCSSRSRLVPLWDLLVRVRAKAGLGFLFVASFGGLFENLTLGAILRIGSDVFNVIGGPRLQSLSLGDSPWSRHSPQPQPGRDLVSPPRWRGHRLLPQTTARGWRGCCCSGLIAWSRGDAASQFSAGKFRPAE